MSRVAGVFLGLLFAFGSLVQSSRAAEVLYDREVPQVAFAVAELSDAFAETGRDDLQVTIVIESDRSEPEAFQIQSEGPGQIQITGSDAAGAVYGGIEVAEFLKLGLSIENVSRLPMLKKRGLKMNIPWDCRTPSYCDKGSVAQNNIVNVWDFEGFWKPYFDDLARYRYNVLSL